MNIQCNYQLTNAHKQNQATRSLILTRCMHAYIRNNYVKFSNNDCNYIISYSKLHYIFLLG